jgi:two-component system chemotaxis sensor kinase CheA
MDDLLSDFLTETNESLAELDVALVTLERTPDDAETLGFIFRLVHTIKGTCGFLGLPRLERVAHAGENVLGRLRDRTLTVTPEIVSQVLACTDAIKAIVNALSETGAEPAGDDAPLIAELNVTASHDTPAASRQLATTRTRRRSRRPKPSRSKRPRIRNQRKPLPPPQLCPQVRPRAKTRARPNPPRRRTRRPFV